MLEKPGLEDQALIDRLQPEFGLVGVKLAFLPLGADSDTFVYRADDEEGGAYFVKLRRGEFNESLVAVPQYLSELGMMQIIPSIRTRAGRLWAKLGPFNVMLYPYLTGCDGYEKPLPEPLWVEFGRALKDLHTADIPANITDGIRREDFSPRWRESLRAHLAGLDENTASDPVTAELRAFLQGERWKILNLVERAEALALEIQAQDLAFTLCHGDIHGWNLLIDDADRLYIVDWDTLVIAPKERDLMFIGGGLGDSGYTPQEEEAMFYRGYGPTEINQKMVAYYRYERIIEDIAIYCEEIFEGEGSEGDREQALVNVKSNFRPGGTIERARAVDGG